MGDTSRLPPVADALFATAPQGTAEYHGGMTNRHDHEFDGVLETPPVTTAEPSPGAPTGPTGSRLDEWWWRQSIRAHRGVRWGSAVVVMVIAAVTRLVGLGHPSSLVFDETFYVKDAWSLSNLGYEGSWPDDADARFNAGDTDIFTNDPAFVVHPPLGKWLIGLGMHWLGADDPAGWRISTALVGIVSVALIMLVAWLIFRSAALASIAGLLLAIDGNAIVMSRVALLDNFVMFFALLGFAAILMDRGWSRSRLDRWLYRRREHGRAIDWGPALWWRPWLLAAAVAFGAATAVKWNGLYFLAALAVYTIVVDAIARRRAGIPFWLSGTLVKQGPVSFLLMVPLAMATYLTAWSGWFITSGGYSRGFADTPENAWSGALAWVPHSIQSLWHFETAVYEYNVGEARPHPYQASPLTWLFLVRPTSMYYQGYGAGENGCAAQCGASITGLANPLIWWAATAAALYLVYRLARYREWWVGLILAGLAAGYLPWMFYLGRTVFQFYTIAFEPYMILALTGVVGIVLGSVHDARWRRVTGIRLVAGFLMLAIALSIFFWPLWTGQQLDYGWLLAHWWLPTWR